MSVMCYSLRLASRESSVFKYEIDGDVLVLAACIKDKLHLNIRNKCDVLPPAACIKRKMRLYIRNRWGCASPGGLHQRQAASKYAQQM